LTSGTVSALDISVELNDGSRLDGLIEISGGVSPFFAADGDSGAAVVNEHNQVIGLLAARRLDGSNFAYAIPIKRVMDALSIELLSPDLTLEDDQTAGQGVDSALTVVMSEPAPEDLTINVRSFQYTEDKDGNKVKAEIMTLPANVTISSGATSTTILLQRTGTDLKGWIEISVDAEPFLPGKKASSTRYL
jgi:S1-C subfamily serine protease